MNNRQQVYPTEAWKYHKLITEPAALCKHGFTVFLLTGQHYGTQQLGRGIGGQYDTSVSFQYDVSLKSTIWKPEILNLGLLTTPLSFS